MLEDFQTELAPGAGLILKHVSMVPLYNYNKPSMKAALGEYWPEVLIVRAECSKVCPKNAEGRYTPCMTRS